MPGELNMAWTRKANCGGNPANSAGRFAAAVVLFPERVGVASNTDSLREELAMRNLIRTLLRRFPAFALTMSGFLIATVRAEEPAASEHPLIVHEWGTFTSFSGSDGIQLDFRPLVDNDLPAFVYSPSSLNPFTKRQIFARQRMETPVTYFYSDVERDVKVSVKFPGGKLTEYYPPPLPSPQLQVFLAQEESEKLLETIDWGTVHVIPEKTLATHVLNPEVASRVNRHISMGLVPWLDEGNPYYEARHTDSALLYVRRTAEEGQAYTTAAADFQGDHFEKFLFYRGAGSFTLPVTVASLSADRVKVKNLSPGDIHGVFVVHNNGQLMRYRSAGTLSGSGEMEVTLPDWSELPNTNPIQELDQKIVEALIAEGLYEKEARAMVKTWKSSWYNEPGYRVFFLVPQVITDSILPLTIEPQPQETLRVLVARMEFMTPEDEKHLLTLMRDSAVASDPGRENLLQDLKLRGRLAEPAILHVAKLSGDPAVQAEAETVRGLLLKGL